MARTTPAEHEDPGLLLESADAIKDARDLDQDRAARTSVAPSGASAQDPRHIAAARASAQTRRAAPRGQGGAARPLAPLLGARGTRGPRAKSALGDEAEGDEAVHTGYMHCTPCDAWDVSAEVTDWLLEVVDDPQTLSEVMQTSGLSRPERGIIREKFCSHEVGLAYAEAGNPQQLVWEGFMGSGQVSVVGPDRRSRVARSGVGTPMEQW